jgi:O-antigen/teichoic acid export membrane protein
MKPSMSNAAANALQAAFSIVLTFVLYRVVIAALGIGQLGVWSVLLATASVSRLSDLGLTAGITRFIARDLAAGDPERAAAVVETGLVALGLAVGVILLAIYAIAPHMLGLAFAGQYLATALDILPYSLVAAWLSVLGMAAVSGLDGCQRFKVKAVILTVSQGLMVPLAMLLLPRMGLRGLAYAQVLQGTFLIVGAWVILRRELSAVPLVPRRCSWPILREMLSYGVKVQASSLTLLLFDPLTKFLMARFGGPQAVGYFEVANQVIAKVRSVILSANQVIVPQTAAIGEQDADSIKSLYAWSLRLTTFVSLPTYALLLASANLISALVFKSDSPEFAFFFSVSILGWAANTFAIPAYFVNLGTGAVGQNLAQHVLMGVANLALGLALGALFFASGVVVAYAVSLALGGVFLVGVFQRRRGVHLGDLALRDHTPLLAVSLAVAVAAALASEIIGYARPYLGGILVVAVAALVLVVPVWLHPLRKELLGAIVARRQALQLP